MLNRRMAGLQDCRIAGFDGSHPAILQFCHPAMQNSVDGPGLRDEKLLEQTDGVAVRHAGDEVARGGVEALGFDRMAIEEFVGPLPDLLP